jgi:putative nucleotidyltransferase with HDIG domain
MKLEPDFTAMKWIFNLLKNRHQDVYKIFLFCLCVGLIVSVFPQEGKFKYDFQRGKPWSHEDLIAPFDFAITKTDAEMESERVEIVGSSKPYFKLLEVPIDDRILEFKQQWKRLSPPEQEIADEKIALKFAQDFFTKVYDRGIIEVNEEIEGKPEDFFVVVLKGNVAEEVELRRFFTVKTVFEFLERELLNIPVSAQNKTRLVMDEVVKQNVVYDPVNTNRQRQESLESISLNKEMKQKGERIISRGDLVDTKKNRIIESLRNEYFQQVGGKKTYWFLILGQVLLVSLCVLMVVIFLFLFRKDVYESSQKFSFILLIIFLFSALAAISFRLKLQSIYFLPFCILPILIRIFFDTRIALFTHLSSILIVGLIVPNPYEFVFIQWIGGVFAVFSLLNLRNRSQLFFSTLIIFMAYIAAFIGISVVREGAFENIKWMDLQGFAVSAVLVLFAYPLIFVFEKVFGLISDVTLLELSDINSPLLRDLAIKAPGTFQHSLQVANLAEEAILKIGGSSLLVRTGALYHDIGKMEMPLYFVENQLSGVNPHDELSFEESAGIIIGHVAKGIEMAKKNNLPDQVIDFIRTHHGTGKAEYFYQSFLKNFPTEVIDVEAFQYPGPLPFSKETAVLMMADAVEASYRSLQRYDIDTLSNLVDKIIDHQLNNGQFNNAEITFRDINLIRKTFKRKLQNIHHLRIEYPH